MHESVTLDELSPAQRRFAERERARPGLRGERQRVFLYREERFATYRWLVGLDGHAIEAMRFHRAA